MFPRLRAIEIIKSIKRNIRCVSVTGVKYEAADVTDIYFNFDLHDIPTLRFEMYFFYGAQYIENDQHIEFEGIYTAFEYQLFGGSMITLHFTLAQIDSIDDDRNDDDPNQYIPDWI